MSEGTATVTDAKTLYECSGEMRAFIACWIEHRRCPLPLVDYLLEQGLESQAEAARWAALEPDRSNVLHTKESQGPFPCYNNGWYWNAKMHLSYSHCVPVNVPLDMFGHFQRHHQTAEAAILWLLDHEEWAGR